MRTRCWPNIIDCTIQSSIYSRIFGQCYITEHEIQNVWHTSVTIVVSIALEYSDCFTLSRYQTPCINNWVPVAAGQTVLIDGLMAIMVLFTPLTQLLVAANSWERHYAVSQTPWLVSTRLTIRGNLASGVGCKVFKCVLMLIGLFSIDKSRLHIIWILK